MESHGEVSGLLPRWIKSLKSVQNEGQLAEVRIRNQIDTLPRGTKTED